MQPRETLLDSLRRRYELVFTELMAVTLIVAAEGRHAYGFYVVLRLTSTVGNGLLGGQGVHAGPRGWL
jgi:hypothetical protein